MKNSRVTKYLQEHMQEVVHTTLNPNGPGVVRIHLVPPREDIKEANGIKHSPSVAIINGKDIIPINISWAILLNEFIIQLNDSVGYGKEISTIDLEKIVNRTAISVKKIYPFVTKARIKKDLLRIVNTLCDVAYGKEIHEEIGYMNIGQYEPFMKAPHRMDLLISAMEKDGRWNCNQKCLHCYAAGQQEAETQELSTEEWKAVIDRCRTIGIPQITFTGGEPTMRDDLVELVDYSQWFVTRLNTNGIRLTTKLCKELYDASLDSVQVTFYSYDSNIHNQLVGVNTYHQTVEGIKNALQAGLNVSINTPLCTINKEYITTLKYAHYLGITYVTCSGLIITGNACKSASQETQLTEEELYGILKEAKAYCDANHMEISFTSPGWIAEEKLTELGLTSPTCGACLSNMAITPNGSVVPCQSWLSAKPLGNILQDSWKSIWNSMRCTMIRKNSAKMEYQCPLRIENKNMTDA